MLLEAVAGLLDPGAIPIGGAIEADFASRCVGAAANGGPDVTTAQAGAAGPGGIARTADNAGWARGSAPTTGRRHWPSLQEHRRLRRVSCRWAAVSAVVIGLPLPAVRTWMSAGTWTAAKNWRDAGLRHWRTIYMTCGYGSCQQCLPTRGAISLLHQLARRLSS